ncbi:MAG: hypothetical protein ACXWLR_15055 [Myxococcales bacterium]
MTVVGIAGDVRDQDDLADTWYLPLGQNAGSGAAATVHLMLRSAQDAGALLLLLVAAVAAALPARKASAIDPMEALRAS